MVEGIPFAVAESLLEKLISATFHEFGRIHGVINELERLTITIESIKAVLLDAEDKQEKDRAVKIWIRRLKEVLHSTDDLLDEFAIEEMRQKVDASHEKKVKKKVAKVLHFLSPNRVVFPIKMSHKIEEIHQNLNDVVQEMSKLNLSSREVVVKQSESVRRETSSFVVGSDIVGREDCKKEIVSLLMQPHKNHEVSSIAIVGIGGLGKTTLAQLVYNDERVQHYFEKQMWVHVSDCFDVRTILMKILESLMNNKNNGTQLAMLQLEKSSLDSLQNTLREKLSGKRYLLVLDDLWNESHTKWTQLRTYLMCGAKDSKVLVTTRSKMVTQAMGVSISHDLNGLTQDESWSLLKNIAFGDDIVGVNQTIESIGKKIAEKCRGVSLAIRTLGGLLQSKSEESEWIDVLQGDFWKLYEDEDSIIPVLKLSYQNLSPKLRQCFAYCSLYPKNCKIEKDELIQLWMAQGYLECSAENQLMEDVGNQFVKIFLMKSFFQDVEMDVNDHITCFKMHDLMHDLATLVAGNDCCYLSSETKTPIGRPMHVSLEPSAIHLLGSLNTSRLRTLILRSSNEEKLNGEELSVVSNFKRLRVLKLSHCSLSKLAGSIAKLKHLRYLNLWHCTEPLFAYKH